MKTVLSVNPILEESIVMWLVISISLTAIIYLVIWVIRRRK
ncbi:hypothetical protein [Lactiplantibacillus pingfangensis]|nr:hypothetical protein [Lactiplantibacillus pingfangensis]